MISAKAALRQPCPVCGADPGRPCRRLDGRENTAVHGMRRSRGRQIELPGTEKSLTAVGGSGNVGAVTSENSAS